MQSLGSPLHGLNLKPCGDHLNSYSVHEPRGYYWPSLIILLILFFILLSVGEAIDSNPDWYLGRKFLMCAVCILLLLPLCLPKTLKVLSYSRSVNISNQLLLLVSNAVKCYLMQLITRSTSLAFVVSGVKIYVHLSGFHFRGPKLCTSAVCI